MANIELKMCKENADSSNYLKIFDLENLCIKNIKTICLIGIGVNNNIKFKTLYINKI